MVELVFSGIMRRPHLVALTSQSSPAPPLFRLGYKPIGRLAIKNSKSAYRLDAMRRDRDLPISMPGSSHKRYAHHQIRAETYASWHDEAAMGSSPGAIKARARRQMELQKHSLRETRKRHNDARDTAMPGTHRTGTDPLLSNPVKKLIRSPTNYNAYQA
jgi:hypothetical protein